MLQREINMGVFVSESQKEFIQNKIKSDARFGKLWRDYVKRVETYTDETSLAKMYDSVKWWHLIWERIGDAAFVYLIDGAKKAGAFVHDAVMHTCLTRKEDEWIGPFFRNRQEPPVGQLETAHISCALCCAVDMCPGLFSDSEKETIKKLLRERVLPWSKRFLENGFVCNWQMVLLNGYATAACVLDDKEAVEYAVEKFNLLKKAYNSDSYGESVQYSNYASLNLTHAYEVLVSYDPSLASVIDTSYQADMIKWYAASFMYMKPLGGEWGDKPYPRTLNFGDSAAIFRPTGDVLMHTAKRFAATRAKEAGLAMWLFETVYKEDLPPFDRSTFGFFNQYHYYTFINYVSPDEVAPLSPKDAGVGLLSTFEIGTVAYRTDWDNPGLLLGIQGGYKPNNVTAHRHKDQNSFILAYKNERMFADPGHCCYRLATQRFSVSEESHSTWTFEREDGSIIRQQTVSGNFVTGIEEPLNVLKKCEKKDNLFVCQSDCAKAYGGEIKKAQRTWLVLGDNLIFLVDSFESEVPVKPIGHFVLNNRGNRTDDRVFYGKRVVFRRNGIGMKFFPLDVKGFNVSMNMNWGALHECYCPEPQRLGQGREGSALIYDFSPDTYTKKYTAVYGIILDSDTDIPKWHTPFVGENKYYLEPGDKTGGFALSVLEDGILKAEDLYNGKEYFIEV